METDSNNVLLMKIVPACTVCSGRGERDHDLDEKWTVYRCQKCDGLYTARRAELCRY